MSSQHAEEIEIEDVDAAQAGVQLLPVSDEAARPMLAYAFAIVFGVTVVLSFAGLLFTGSMSRGPEWTSQKEWLELVLPAQTALLGSAVGFYFGSKKE